MIPETISELQKYMEDECYNFASYSIAGNIIYEGFGLEKSGSLYIWFYTERGNKENLHYFNSEKEAVEYAFHHIKSDKYSRSHLFLRTKDNTMKSNIVKELEEKEIDYWVEEIPSLENKLYRIFIVGCDIRKVKNITSVLPHHHKY